MCIPKPDVSAPPPSNVQSLASATGLQVGGAPRGAAGLGRLKLRLDGKSSATPSPTPSQSAPTQDPSTGGSAPDQSGQGPSAVIQRVPNYDLRLPVM